MDSEKYVLDLSDEAKAARKAYKRAWNAKNRDKCRESQRRFWEKKAREAKNERDPV